jgi:molecular chaperone DnaK
MTLAVGIDLGTTNTVVGVVRDGVVATLGDERDRRLLPSVVSFDPSGAVWVGGVAAERRLTDPTNTIYSVKRLIGRPWSSDEVKQAVRQVSFELRQGPQDSSVVVARGEMFSLPEISAFVLKQAKAIAEARLGETVQRAVITVPANFNELQRAATKTAGRLAGLEVLRILNEPTAAALAYGPPERPRERVAVYDLGGGTFDVTLLDVVGNIFEVLATAGDTALGGDDIDILVAERMADELSKKFRIDVRSTPADFSRLRLVGEQMKRALSSAEAHEVAIDEVFPSERRVPSTWRFRMTRPELEWASLELIDRTFQVCNQAFASVGCEPGDVDRVILVGGATRMPLIARKVQQFFGRAPVARINPDEVVALGAAIQAELLDRSRPKSAGRQTHPQISPESIVDHGPRAQGSTEIPDLPFVEGPRKSALAASSSTASAFAPAPIPVGQTPLLIDVTPLSLCVETAGGYCDVLIEANTPIPCDRTRSFVTASDGQTTVQVRVGQGSLRRFGDNTLLGEIELSGIPPAPRGVAEIAVTFEIDADGIVNVRARDTKTKHETSVRIQLVGAQTSRAELDAMRGRQAAHPLASDRKPR